MERALFIERVHGLWPHAKQDKIVTISPGNHIAVLHIGDHTPFIVGLKYGHPTPISTSVLRDLERHFSNVLDEVRGALDLVHALSPRPDTSAFNALLGIPPND